MFKHGLVQTYADTLSAIMHVVDPLLVVAASWAAYYATHHRWELPENYPLLITVAALLTVSVFPVFRLYESWRGESIRTEVQALLLAWGLVLVGVLVLTVATKTSAYYSRLWMGYWAGYGAVLLMGFRATLRLALRWARSRGFNRRNIVIVGSGELARQVAAELANAPWTGLNVVGFFAESDQKAFSRNDCPRLGGIEQLTERLKPLSVDQVWLAIPLSQQEIINRVLFSLRYSTVDVRLVLDIFSYQLLNARLGEIAGLPVLDLSASPLHGINRYIKAAEDRVLGLLILALISPLMAAIAVGVKLSSPGPVLFRQRRHGYDGQEVEVWKFRTMYIHQEGSDQVTQATRHDARVTRFGAFLRHTSLDELPQFINVLQGRMSIVGPRPHATAHNEFYKGLIERYMLRHKVKPGITGWAQVNGLRGETESLEKMKRRIDYDLYYIENWSVWLDLKIILLTLFRGFISKNAY